MYDGRPVELVLPASRHGDLTRVRTVLHANDVRLAKEEEIKRFFIDCEPGAVPPLRHWKDIDVLMYRSLNLDGKILFAVTHQDAVRLYFRDWYEIVKHESRPLARQARLHMGNGAAKVPT